MKHLIKTLSTQLGLWIQRKKDKKMIPYRRIQKETAWTPDKRCKYIGHSLGNCVLDILEGTMPLKCVAEIHSGTRIKTIDALDQVIDNYMEHIWFEYTKEEVLKIINHVIFEKRFFQIRCQPVHHNVVDGKNGHYQKTSPSVNPREYRKPLHFNWEKIKSKGEK